MPCYGTGNAGIIRRAMRFLERHQRRMDSGRVLFRCPDCNRLKSEYRADGPPDECPDCGRDVADRWHEVTEG